MLDIGTLRPAETGEFLHLRHPAKGLLFTEDDEKVGFWLVGRDSPEWTRANHSIVNNGVKRRIDPEHPITSEQLEAEATDLLVACVKKVTGLVMDGEPVTVPDGVRKLLSDPGFRWIREAIDKFIRERANFLKV